jgi:hypothetical protein
MDFWFGFLFQFFLSYFGDVLVFSLNYINFVKGFVCFCEGILIKVLILCWCCWFYESEIQLG